MRAIAEQYGVPVILHTAGGPDSCSGQLRCDEELPLPGQLHDLELPVSGLSEGFPAGFAVFHCGSMKSRPVKLRLLN